MSEPATYVSFLVRLWREPGQEAPAPPTDWHSEIECIQTGQRWMFNTLEELLDFLCHWVEQLEPWDVRRMGQRFGKKNDG